MTNLSLSARPEPVPLDPANTALIVIDMQNAYASKGGYVDRAGFDVTNAQQAVDKVSEAVSLSRQSGIQVVFLQNGWDKAYVEAGTPLSPNWHKSNALRTMRSRPELAGKLLARGGWDYDIVDALKPDSGDIVIAKPRYSAFFNSQLDSILRSRRIRHLIFVGIATNVCVESTIRDGFHLEYFCTMLDDATHHLGPDYVRQASIYNIEKFFGWVSSVEEYRRALAFATPPSEGV
jgi:ureidoacrylate peracid hydrolase